jgi:hypothetical protein
MGTMLNLLKTVLNCFLISHFIFNLYQYICWM